MTDRLKTGAPPFVLDDVLNRFVGFRQPNGETDYFSLGRTLGAGRKGYIYGLTLSNNGSDATNDIDIAAGEAVDNTTGALMSLPVAITKRLDAVWSAGTDKGGLDAAASTLTNTTYHVYLIGQTDRPAADVIFSASASAPTLPSGYTHYRRIGSIIRASAAIVAFTQRGDEFLLNAPAADMAVVLNPGTAAILWTLASVPLGIKVDALLTVRIADATPSTSWSMLISSPDQADTVPSSTLWSLRVVNTGSATIPQGVASAFRIRTNTSAQVRTRQDLSTDTDVSISGVTHGWIDTRGRL